MMFEVSRRSFVTGLVALVAAPAIVKATSLMPVRPWRILTAADICPGDRKAILRSTAGLDVGDWVTIYREKDQGEVNYILAIDSPIEITLGGYAQLLYGRNTRIEKAKNWITA